MTTIDGSPEVAAPPWTPDDSTFGARLALIRQYMKWGNVKEAARECGVPSESWRNWEEGMEPRRLNTIAVAIATRTGCNYFWLAHGPEWQKLAGPGSLTLGYPSDDLESELARIVAGEREGRVVVTAGQPRRGRGVARQPATRPVRQTRPVGGSIRPVSLTAIG